MTPEFATRLNGIDELHVEEDVQYDLIEPIIKEGDPEGVSIYSNSTIEQYSLLLSDEEQYGITMIEASKVSRAWMYGPKTKKICIIDTGYYYDHTDLPKAGVSGYSGHLNEYYDWKQDGHGHGTHLAGVIGALQNEYGVSGIASNINLPLHIVRIFDAVPRYVWASDLLSTVQECVNAGSNVVNMSLGRNGNPTQAEITAFKKFLHDDNVLVVSAAGNSGMSTNAPFYPAAYDTVISVASVGENRARSSYSTHNSKVNLAAPGENILSTTPDGAYKTMSGTSMATPHVSGV
eukprot:CAMPEP_0194269468 /NCGR_PEP_ID=MMETSP0169-20130528/3618_1 /TAXON_ID=218684 /ORGANISM="Corethron pennatum, Strain L29A3" /LENGTH=290 /DNA_ID=CAMNT_0039011117 /DNA_START=591 /DNA_END=1459 /DNA_ORIENTATION=+